MDERRKLQQQWEKAAEVKDTLTMRRVQQEMRKLLMKEMEECSKQP